MQGKLCDLLYYWQGIIETREACEQENKQAWAED